MDSFIKLYRRFLKWEWADTPNMVSLFIHLLLLAKYEDKEWHGVTIKRGQLVTGRVALAKIVGISEQQVRTCLARLQDTGEISLKSTNKFTIITICKFDSYQQNEKAEQPTNNQQITNNQPTNNQQITTPKESKEIKKVKNNNKTPIIPFEVSPEFLPAFTLWLEYKKGKKQSYKGEKSLKAIYKRLLTLSGNNPDVAMAIVEQAMANNWAGLYALKDDHVANGDKRSQWEQEINKGAWDDINKVFNNN